ncbi:MAG: hypothetical protein IJ106_02550 [Parasporobacterium sp.]|nr:hypothetical protein [Parasporobacterium sp.]
MNVTLIGNHDNLITAVPCGDVIVEYYSDPARKDIQYIQVFDPVKNTLFEVSPDLPKIRFVEISNCIWQSEDLYYASCDVLENNRMDISVYRYSLKERSEKKICSFIRNLDILNEDKRVKLFILNESTILMQTEILQKSLSQNLLGNIEFVLNLYNLETANVTTVTDANFINNGINEVIPVSETKILVKTGYSYIEDNRLDTGSKSESFIESIYIATVAKFIADLTLAKENLDMPLIESAYLDRHITKPFVSGSYTHFCIVDEETRTAKCVFFNNETEERTEYTEYSFDPEDLYITHVIDNIPYVRIKSGDDVKLVNLKTAEADILFYDEHFIAQSGTLFVTESADSGRKMHIYSYPRLRLEAEDDRDYSCMCRLKDDYYIYC